MHYLLSEFRDAPEKIWETNIFGKSLSELVREELSHKLSRMPDDARSKIRETLEKIINENAGGLICIILVTNRGISAQQTEMPPVPS